MKIVVIGGTGLIGSKVVTKLNAHGHEAIAASPDTGVNSITGEGLAEVMQGANVLIDVSNAPAWEDSAVMDFFTTATTNLLAEAKRAGVGHYVALSVVGTQKLGASGYFRAKIAQEQLIVDSGLPYSIVHATQFFEFIQQIAQAATHGDEVRLPPARIRPMAAEDVAIVVGRTAAGEPRNGIVEVAGPDEYRLDELIRDVLAKRSDPRTVVTDPDAQYFGITPTGGDLVPEFPDPTLGATRFQDWFEQQLAAA
jgi:uncharacterized protein YbjT (DUF2867 family)